MSSGPEDLNPPKETPETKPTQSEQLKSSMQGLDPYRENLLNYEDQLIAHRELQNQNGMNLGAQETSREIADVNRNLWDRTQEAHGLDPAREAERRSELRAAAMQGDQPSLEDLDRMRADKEQYLEQLAEFRQQQIARNDLASAESTAAEMDEMSRFLADDLKRSNDLRRQAGLPTSDGPGES